MQLLCRHLLPQLAQTDDLMPEKHLTQETTLATIEGIDRLITFVLVRVVAKGGIQGS